jgi:hypothetical protein
VPAILEWLCDGDLSHETGALKNKYRAQICCQAKIPALTFGATKMSEPRQADAGDTHTF